MRNVPAASGKQWSWWVCLFGVMARPGLVLDRTDRMHAGLAYLIHLIGLVLLGPAVLLFVDACAAFGNEQDHGALLQEMVADVRRQLFDSGTPWAVLGIWFGMTLLQFIIAELGLLVFALLMQAWAARPNEQPVDGLLRALTRMWRLTPHWALVALLLAVLTSGWEQVVWALHETTGYFGHWDWSDPQFEWWLSREAAVLVFFVLLWLAGSLYALWMTMHALGAGHRAACCRWPLTCEKCGYALMGIPDDGNCPECGQARTVSVDESRRPGAGVQRGLLSLGGWLESLAMPLIAPGRFGRKIQTMTGSKRHLAVFWFWIFGLCLVSFCGSVFVAALGTALSPHSDADELLQIILVVTLWTGSMSVLAYVTSALPSASIVGGLMGRGQKRNLLPAGAIAGAHAGPFVLAWCAVWWVFISGFVAIAVSELLRDMPSAWYATLWALWLVFSLGMIAALYLGVPLWTWLILRGARYANR